MITDDPEKDHFSQAVDYLSKEGRYHVLDSLACMFHNQGYSLQGNTESNDALWLARQIYSDEVGRNGNLLDDLPDQDKARYVKLADLAIKALPALCGRISARYINLAQALRTMEKVSREQVHQLRDELRERRPHV